MSFDHEHTGGESASSVDEMLACDGSGLYASIVLIAHYHSRVLSALWARFV